MKRSGHTMGYRRAFTCGQGGLRLNWSHGIVSLGVGIVTQPPQQHLPARWVKLEPRSFECVPVVFPSRSPWGHSGRAAPLSQRE